MKTAISILGAIAFLAACAAEPTTSAPGALPTRVAGNQGGDAQMQQDLATLRAVTAPFHRFEAAQDAAYSTKITSCMADPMLGGMGFHYGNVGLIDGTLEVNKPELLLYEPEKDGKLRFVAVEYVLPYTFRSRSAEPPVLFGQQFKQNDRFQLWGLHVWVGRENPSGIFASWNPRVTCDNTTDVDVAPMTH